MNGRSKYAYIKQVNGIFNVIFYDNIEDVKTNRNETLIHNVVFHIADGILYINGLEDEAHFAEDKISINSLKYKVRERDIRHYDGFKLIGIKPYDYVYGWWAYEAKNYVSYAFRNFSLKIIE